MGAGAQAGCDTAMRPGVGRAAVSILGEFSVYGLAGNNRPQEKDMLVALAIGGVFYALVVLFGLSIGRAARRGDEMMRRGSRDAGERLD